MPSLFLRDLLQSAPNLALGRSVRRCSEEKCSERLGDATVADGRNGQLCQRHVQPDALG